MSLPNCPQCGTQVNDDLPGGLCAACLIQVARQSAKDLGETVGRDHEIANPNLAELERLFPELEIIELVGRGGMGAVYRVRQKNLDRIVALKVFLYRPNDPEFAARFQREARALAKLKHPNIVTVHDFGERDTMHYLIMEFVDGLNLRQITAEERLSPEMALQMVPLLCDALQYAHDQGVIHRDIKPENLLLDTDGGIKIADFGLAKMTGSGNMGTLTHTRQVMGTLNYMAPEQRERPSEVDHRADIYSLGVVIYEMLTGELPIGRFLPPSEKSELNANLDEVVMRALEKEPNLRYQQASEFKTGFESQGEFANATQHVNQFASPSPLHQPVNAPVQPVKYEYEYEEQEARLLLTIMSGREKKGNWRPGNPQWVFTMMGGTELDVSQVQAPEITLNLFTMMGGTEIVVSPDAEVDVDGFILFGATNENIKPSDDPVRQKVRIRSWGAMGGCEVRTAKPKKKKRLSPPTKEAPATSIQHYREPPTHNITFRSGLVFVYKMFAILTGFACAILFLFQGMNVVESDDARLAAIIAAITCGMLWAGLGYFRRIIGAGPESDDEDAIREYYSTSVIGTMIRSLALMCGFAVPMMFVAAAFARHEKDEIRTAAIVCGILCAVLYVAASYFEEFFYGKLKDE